MVSRLRFNCRLRWMAFRIRPLARRLLHRGAILRVNNSGHHMRNFRTLLVLLVCAVGLTAYEFWPQRSAPSSAREIQVAAISSSANTGAGVLPTPANPP